ncbi:hypothetical protein BJV74DRAFT_81299 [Russula compacta]|nr:hypothetical protein BJV74DRAFT_81299 [Russula compacta]
MGLPSPATRKSEESGIRRGFVRSSHGGAPRCRRLFVPYCMYCMYNCYVHGMMCQVVGSSRFKVQGFKLRVRSQDSDESTVGTSGELVACQWVPTLGSSFLINKPVAVGRFNKSPFGGSPGPQPIIPVLCRAVHLPLIIVSIKTSFAVTSRSRGGGGGGCDWSWRFDLVKTHQTPDGAGFTCYGWMDIYSHGERLTFPCVRVGSKLPIFCVDPDPVADPLWWCGGLASERKRGGGDKPSDVALHSNMTHAHANLPPAYHHHHHHHHLQY